MDLNLRLKPKWTTARPHRNRNGINRCLSALILVPVLIELIVIKVLSAEGSYILVRHFGHYVFFLQGHPAPSVMWTISRLLQLISFFVSLPWLVWVGIQIALRPGRQQQHQGLQGWSPALDSMPGFMDFRYWLILGVGGACYTWLVMACVAGAIGAYPSAILLQAPSTFLWWDNAFPKAWWPRIEFATAAVLLFSLPCILLGLAMFPPAGRRDNY